MYYHRNGVATAAPRVVSGRGITHRRLDKRQRAVLAADIFDGLAVLQPSARQLARQLGVNEGYVRLARDLTPEKRKAILSGRDSTSFRRLLNPLTARRALPAPTLKPAMTDEHLVALAQQLGADRWLSAGARAEL